MKRFVLILALCAVACSEYQALREEVDDLDRRVALLETAVANLNKDVESLRSLVQAASSGKTILKVVPDTQDGVECWHIYFTETEFITVRSGKDAGQGSVPSIGLAQDPEDGNWYWTLGGDWLTDADGVRVRANGEAGPQGPSGDPGSPGITPMIDIQEGNWVVSTDGGQTWEEIGPASDPSAGLITAIDYTTSEYEVYFTLAGGGTITLPKQVKMSISFESTLVEVSVPGQVVEVKYEITGGTEDNIVKAVAQGLWMASVTAETPWKGTIKAMAPEELSDCEVVVYVSDGRGYTVLSSIVLVAGQFMADVSVPGIYGSCGINYEYRRGLDQINIFNAEGVDWFRFVIPSEVRVYEVGGIPETVSEGMALALTVDEYLMGEKMASNTYGARVMSVTADLVKLASTDGSGIILRR